MQANESLKKGLSTTGGDSRRWIVLGALIIIYVLANFAVGGSFLTQQNLHTILSHSVQPALIAWGMSFIFTTGVIDLSIGANIMLSANIGAMLAIDFGMGYPGLILGSIVSVIVLEHITVRISQNLLLPPWIAGLGMALVYEAILSLYSAEYTKSHAQSVPNLPDELKFFGSFRGMLILLVICGIAAYILFNNTSLGINVRAVGDNEQVAGAMGIDKKKVVFLGALVGAVFIGIAALQAVSYTGNVKPFTNLTSIGNIFRALATFLLATSFTFVASVPVTIFFSSFAVMSLFNFLTMIGVPTGTGQNVCLGAVVILCGVLSRRGYKGVSK